MTLATSKRKGGDVPPLDQLYFEWLYSQVSPDDEEDPRKTHWKLLELLHRKEFVWDQIERDENRAEDGKAERMEFLRNTRTKISNRAESVWMEEPCSVLEMLVALAFRMAFQSIDDAHTPVFWFWEMMENLDLAKCTDADPIDEMTFHIIIERVLNREYGTKGAGGLFPLNHTKQNQQDVELWYQAEAYLLEHI